VPGYPVFVAADTEAEAARLARDGLALFLRETVTVSCPARVQFVKVLRPNTAGAAVRLVGMGAMLGRAKSAAKARTSRANGKLGGRPRADSARRAR